MAAAKETHAALVLKENEWQQYQDSNLAELARQKAAAERRAERADAAIIRHFDGARGWLGCCVHGNVLLCPLQCCTLGWPGAAVLDTLCRPAPFPPS